MAIGITVKEDMTESVSTVKPKDAAERVLKKIVDLDIGAVIVVKDQKPIGIITSTDLLKKVFYRGKNPEEVKVEDIMTHPIRTIDANTDIKEATEIMRDLGIKRLPVTENEKLVGIISETDLIAIDPAVHEIIAEKAKTKRFTPPKQESFTGICEECGSYSENLITKEGRLVCPECR